MYQFHNSIFLCLLCYNVLAERDCSVRPTSQTDTLRLKADVLCDYETTVRPVLHHGTQTTVFVSMFLRSIVFDSHTTSLNINCWMIWEWTDEHLQWNPSDYGRLDTLHVDSDEIWVPEISEFASSAEWDLDLRMPYGRCEVKSTGNVSCVPSTSYFILCTPDLTYWPYDQVNCSLRLGAWMQKGEEINLTTLQDDVDLLNYKPNREWNMMAATARKHLENYGNNVTFPWIQYSFVMQRHSSLYEATLVVSALMFSVIVLMTFWLQRDGSIRINLSCVSLLCHYLHFQYMGWILQNNGDKCPLIVLFFRDSMLLTGLSVVLAITLRCLTTTSAASPRWVNGIISWTLSFRPGQLLLWTNPSAEGAGSENVEETEGESENARAFPENKTQGWAFLAILLDRICFLVFTLLYIIFIVRCFI